MLVVCSGLFHLESIAYFCCWAGCLIDNGRVEEFLAQHLTLAASDLQDIMVGSAIAATMAHVHIKMVGFGCAVVVLLATMHLSFVCIGEPLESTIDCAIRV